MKDIIKIELIFLAARKKRCRARARSFIGHFIFRLSKITFSERIQLTQTVTSRSKIKATHSASGLLRLSALFSGN